MKKKALLFICLAYMFTTYSQSYIGYLSDNYSGINSVISNPANIVDSRFKTDINLVGASALLGTDYYSLGFTELFDSDFDFEDESLRSPTDDNNMNLFDLLPMIIIFLETLMY